MTPSSEQRQRRRRERYAWPPDPEPLPGPVVDNHTHLDSIHHVLGGVEPGGEWYPDGDGPEHVHEPVHVPTVAEHLARAAAVGVPRLVTVGCDLDAVTWTDAAVREHDALVGAVAIHPNEAVLHAGVREVGPDGLEPDPQPRHEVPLDDAIARVAATARDNPRIRAIGETGMDLFRTGPQGERVQRESFRAHLALAKELGLPLQIHDREAHAEVVEVLLADGAPERTVFHCFSGDAALARLAADHGWYLSFAGPLTFGANDALRAALAVTPLDRVLVETDAPYLTPHPFRGRPNAPYLLPHTVRRAAEVKGLELAEFCAAVVRNTAEVYGSW
ncbi:TatD family hydrolase [Luteimicrobium xylanilyticum]|uniref:Putative metal-dependent hydrolase TatD n=1 Tax=Luteimicrobium xylanilyticum TaxID=1133546 RepID=A0A5P9QCX2_9MICO|nr:TatD family hydrolase [Luteimicrobium xylanilyticum]QFU99318.1 putative metal-dependent hydrolase TatD [Luteimicrobium xylanilyticum]